MKSVLVATGFVAFLSCPVSAAESIVGRWDYPQNACATPVSVTTIKPLSISSESLFCDFRSVKRQGKTVTWKGVCEFADDSSRQTVTARLMRNGSLSMRFAPRGIKLSGLRRCN
jgi:hypothetical protein